MSVSSFHQLELPGRRRSLAHPGSVPKRYHGPTRAQCARRGRDQSAKALNYTVGMVNFPSQSFDVLEGTRNASSLSITDLLLDVAAAGSTLFGCEAPGCLFGRVLFQTPSTPSGQVEFGSTMAAQESFVFTVPEPATQLLQALALVSIAGMRSRNSLLRSAR